MSGRERRLQSQCQSPLYFVPRSDIMRSTLVLLSLAATSADRSDPDFDATIPMQIELAKLIDPYRADINTALATRDLGRTHVRVLTATDR
jgi:hypothetical protein